MVDRRTPGLDPAGGQKWYACPVAACDNEMYTADVPECPLHDPPVEMVPKEEPVKGSSELAS